LRPTRVVAAENLFLRRQLAMYVERGVKPRRPDVATCVSPAVCGRRDPHPENGEPTPYAHRPLDLINALVYAHHSARRVEWIVGRVRLAFRINPIRIAHPTLATTSVAVPFVFKPHRLNGRLSIDGLLSHPVPVGVAIREAAV
jgi:hypothetical protein